MSAAPLVEPSGEIKRAWALLAEVPDPEIPVISVVDLGIVRDVRIDGDELVVAVAPTYSGCPATEVIERDILAQLNEHGFDRVRAETVLSPAWTTDWISADGREKLRAWGIAPPAGSASLHRMKSPDLPAACPRCESTRTVRVSEFGSTPCKAAWRCEACLEPFEQFKCI